MNRILVVTSILLLLLAYYLVSKENSPTSKKIKDIIKPNVVTQKESVKIDMAAIQAEVERDQKVKMDRFEQVWLSYLSGSKVEALDANSTYLDAYRDYKYFDHCMMIIGNILYETDPVDAVLGFRRSQSDEIYHDLPQAQKEMIQERIEKCVSLTHFDAHLYYPERAQNNLKMRMESITPKSAYEIELASVFSLNVQFEKSFYSVERLRKGENIDDELFFDLRSQKNELEEQYPQRLSLFGGYAASDLPIVNHLNEQIKTIEDQIEINKTYDKDALKSEEENLRHLLAQIENMLFNVNSSDAYLAVNDTLNNSRFEHALKPIKNNIQQKLNLAPEKYSKFLQPIVTHLRACELGHPCGPDSVLAEEKCLDFADNNSFKACGLGVLDYYLTHHLSPLQLVDVEFILDKGF